MASSDLTVLRFIKEDTIGLTPNNSVQAAGTLTATANFANTETVTIGGRVYTFQTVLTNVSGNVLIGATLTASLLNLRNAINGSGGVRGVDYAAATVTHPTVSAPASNATTLTVRALLGGVAGNAIATTEGSVNASFGAATLLGGIDTTNTDLTQIRFTGESLNYNIENTNTAEITPTRVQTDLVQTAASGGGDINFELSFNSFRSFLEGLFCGEWTPSAGATETLVNGTTRSSYTIQKHFQDMTPQQFHTYTGCVVEAMTLKMEIGKIIEGSFSFMAFGADVTEAQIAGANYVAAPSTTPMNAVVNVQNFSIDGVPYSGCISSLDLSIKNNVRAIQCIGSIKARDMKLGTLEVTGSMEFYFNEGSNYAKFVAGTEFDFSFDMVDDVGNKYSIDLQRAKFESGEVVAGGKNSDVMFSAKWRALYDQTTSRVIRIVADPV